MKAIICIIKNRNPATKRQIIRSFTGFIIMANSFLKLFNMRLYSFPAFFAEQYDKLISPQTKRQPGPPKNVFQLPGKKPQDFVACFMPETVIDLLKIIEINIYNRQIDLPLAPQTGHIFIIGETIAKPRKRIALCYRMNNIYIINIGI